MSRAEELVYDVLAEDYIDASSVATRIVGALSDAGQLPSDDLMSDISWLARLARGSSWPGEMAERVEATAARVIAWTHGGPAGGEGR